MNRNAPHRDDVVIGAREQLFHLLAEASEIEHTLMCSYLFAAFSLKRGAGSGLTAPEAQAVEDWHAAIIGVAVEEMSHLLLVANLSVAIGGRPHFDRPNFPVEAGYFPSGVVVKLAPFSLQTLDHMIFLERPRGMDLPDGEGFEPDVHYVREEAFHGLMPSVQDYPTIGDLYDALRANLIASDKRLGSRALFIGSAAAQVSGEQLGVQHVAVITDLPGALEAIRLIVEQGEGAAGSADGSHFERFNGIREQYQQLLALNPAFEPAWPVVESPVMRRPPDPAGKVFVDNPASARMLDFANAIYTLLLRFLVQAFGRQGADAAPSQKLYIGAAIELMHLLSEACTALVRMPASDAEDAARAGVTFTMLRSVEPFLPGGAERQLTIERVQELAAGAAALENAHSALHGVAKRLHRLADTFVTAAPAA